MSFYTQKNFTENSFLSIDQFEHSQISNKFAEKKLNSKLVVQIEYCSKCEMHKLSTRHNAG